MINADQHWLDINLQYCSLNYIKPHNVPTHLCPSITVVKMKYFSIKCNIDAQIKVLPVPIFPKVVLWQALSFNQFSLRNSTRKKSDNII